MLLVFTKKKISNYIIEGIQLIITGFAFGLLAYFFDFTVEKEDYFFYILGSIFIILGGMRIINNNTKKNIEPPFNNYEIINTNYDLPEKLIKLNDLYKKGAITEEEYLEMKNNLLNS